MAAATDLDDLERRLWAAADELRANSSLTAAQYRDPALGLIFLAFAEHRFEEVRPELEGKATARRPVTADDRAHGVLFVPEIARLSYLVGLPEGEDLGDVPRHVDLAMDAVEETNAGLRDESRWGDGDQSLPSPRLKIQCAVLGDVLARLVLPVRGDERDAASLVFEDAEDQEAFVFALLLRVGKERPGCCEGGKKGLADEPCAGHGLLRSGSARVAPLPTAARAPHRRSYPRSRA